MKPRAIKNESCIHNTPGIHTRVRTHPYVYVCSNRSSARSLMLCLQQHDDEQHEFIRE